MKCMADLANLHIVQEEGACFSYSRIDKDLTNTVFTGVEVQGDTQRNFDERLWKKKKHWKGSFSLPI